MKFYKVGGCVRDKIMGMSSKDIDYVCVLDDINITVEEGFKKMEDYLIKNNYRIFLSTPECYTIRARSPKNEVADFVLARKEIGYIEDTRRPILELGTLTDDLFRRDFTVNAIAEDEEGNIIDPFNGVYAIESKILTTPGSPLISINDDPLRIFRAIRFKITKGFEISSNLHIEINLFLQSYKGYNKLKVVSTERIREELNKCFEYDSYNTLSILYEEFPILLNVLKDRNIYFKPTIKPL